MASSKNSNILDDAPQIKKVKRGRQRKTETPPMVEIPIPVQQNLEIPKRTRNKRLSMEKKVELVTKDTPRTTRNRQPLAGKIEMTPKETPRKTRNGKLALETKIALANEVARAQLCKRGRKKLEPIINVTTKDDNKIEITVDVKPECNGPATNANSACKKVPASKATKKATNNKTEATKRPTNECPTATNKKSADTTPKPAKIRKIETTTTESEKPKKKAPVKRTITLQRKNPKRKKCIQGKEKSDDVVKGDEKCLPKLGKVTVENVENVAVKLTPGPVDSRKTSMTSASSLSWTKDISSSSTTTCVTVRSNDFFCIDNKIPILRVTNVDSELSKYTKSQVDDDSTSNSESSSSSGSSSYDDLINLHTGSLHLSTSSPMTVRSIKNNVPKHDSIKGDVTSALLRLSTMLKNFDMEIMNWIGYGDCVDIKTEKCNDFILNVLKEENDVIKHCRQLKRIFSTRPPLEEENLNDQVNTPNLHEEFDSNDNNPITNDNVLLNHNAEYVCSPKTTSACTDDDTYSLDNFNYASFQRNNDDDDALSLFAESITGMDSKSDKDDSSDKADGVDDIGETALVNEEYIPQPLNTSCSSDKHEYVPTKITTADEEAIKKNVCEKQNADSTSIYKESKCDNDAISEGEIEESICGDPPPNCSKDFDHSEVENAEEMRNQTNSPRLTSIFRNMYCHKTVIFRGICHHNLMNMCHKPRCPYPHTNRSLQAVKDWLMTMNEEMFLEEFAFIRVRLTLRRKYGMCFVEECLRRGMIRHLVEMAIDFTVNFKPAGQQDMKLQFTVLEYIILGLNDVGLAVCEDLLTFPIDGDTRLCHIMMNIIANSPNFTRFKYVFTNLTNVMVRHQLTFRFDVAALILERVCILPPEGTLLRAVLNIIKHTDPLIFTNSMIPAFEARLNTLNCGWIEEFLEVKNRCVATPMLKNLLSITKKVVNVEPLNINCINKLDEETYTSPDTTIVDSLQNNQVPEPLITRTVNFTRTCYNPYTPKKQNSDDRSKNNKFNHWRHNTPNRAPRPFTPNLFTSSTFRPRGPQQIRHRSSPINYRHRPPRNY